MFFLKTINNNSNKKCFEKEKILRINKLLFSTNNIALPTFFFLIEYFKNNDVYIPHERVLKKNLIFKIIGNRQNFVLRSGFYMLSFLCVLHIFYRRNTETFQTKKQINQ